MKPRYIFDKDAIISITRRNTKGSYGKLIDIIYSKIEVMCDDIDDYRYGHLIPACFTFHGDHHTANESDDGKKLIIEKIFV